MSADRISSRAVIGAYYARLEQGPAPWVNALSMYFGSDQAEEEYSWLGQSPAMREFIGGRHAKGFSENGIKIKNKEFEATLEVPVSALRRDKSGQILIRVREMGDKTNDHWTTLLSQLLLNGSSSLCYDGQYYFDTDHSEGKSGTQSNSITVDISDAPVNDPKGTATNPSVAMMQHAILEGVQAIFGFKDDQGDPMNENAKTFVVMVPTKLWKTASAAVSVEALAGGETALIKNLQDVSIQVVTNARLDWTNKFVVFRADAETKPFIRQEEVAPEMSAIAEGSELEFKKKKHWYGAYASRNVGYGYWQYACLVTLQA